MSQEIIYTSAAAGLKPGSRGFCTVAATRGIAKPLADQLEDLSGYRHLSTGGGTHAANPIVYSHLKLSIAGRTYHVLSRICDAGLDYSRRTNKLAHHIALEPTELVTAGPATLLAAPGFMATSWSGDPAVRDFGPRLPQVDTSPGVCNSWAQVAGDAGWGGVVAEALAGDVRRQVVLVYRAGVDVLRLVSETLALLPPAKRWESTFCTYFTKLPPTVDCRWRCVVDGTPEAVAAVRAPGALVIDLRSPLNLPAESPYVEAARKGRLPSVPATVAASLSLGTPSRKNTADDLLLESLEGEMRETRKRPSTSPSGATTGTYGVAPPPMKRPFWEGELAHNAPTQIAKRRRPVALWSIVTIVAFAVILIAAYSAYSYLQRRELVDEELLLAASKADAKRISDYKSEAAEIVAERMSAERAKAEEVMREKAKAEADKTAREKVATATPEHDANKEVAPKSSAPEQTPQPPKSPSFPQLPVDHTVFVGSLSEKGNDFNLPAEVVAALSEAKTRRFEAINIDRQQKGVLRVMQDTNDPHVLLVKKEINYINATIATISLDNRSLHFKAKADISNDLRTIAGHLLRVIASYDAQNSVSFKVAFWERKKLEPFQFTNLGSLEVFERKFPAPLVEARPQLGSVQLDRLPAVLRVEALQKKQYSDEVDIAVWETNYPEERILMRIKAERRQDDVVVGCRLIPTCFDNNSQRLALRQLILGTEPDCYWHLVKARREQLQSQYGKDTRLLTEAPEFHRKLMSEAKQCQLILSKPVPQEQLTEASKRLKSISEQTMRLENEVRDADRNVKRISSQLPIVERFEKVIDELKYSRVLFEVVVSAQQGSNDEPIVVQLAATETASNK